MQTEDQPLSALLQELEAQEGPDFRHTRRTEARLKHLLGEVQRHDQVSEDIVSRVDSVLEMAASKADFLDERSTASRSSASKSSKSAARIQERVEKLMNKIHSDQFHCKLLAAHLKRLFEDVEQIDAEPDLKEDLRVELMDADEIIKELERIKAEDEENRQSQPSPPHPSLTPAHHQVLRCERNTPKFNGKRESFPQWNKDFDEYLSHEVHLTKGAKYQALLEGTESSTDAKEIVRSCSTIEQAIAQLRCQYFKPHLLIYRFLEGMIKRNPVGEDDLDAYRTLLMDIKGYAKHLEDHQRGHILREGAFIAVLSIPYKRRRDFKLDDTTLTDEVTVNAVSNVTPTVLMQEK